MNTISWKWVAISALIFLICEVVIGLVFGVFTFVTFGLGGLLWWIVKPLVYLTGAFIAGYISKGVTIKEPAIAATVLVIVGAFFNSHSDFLGTLVVAAIAFVCAMVGATAGERFQRNSGGSPEV